MIEQEYLDPAPQAFWREIQRRFEQNRSTFIEAAPKLKPYFTAFDPRGAIKSALEETYGFRAYSDPKTGIGIALRVIQPQVEDAVNDAFGLLYFCSNNLTIDFVHEGSPAMSAFSKRLILVLFEFSGFCFL